MKLFSVNITFFMRLSCRVTSSSSIVKTSQTSSSSSKKVVKKGKKVDSSSSRPSSSVASTEASTATTQADTGTKVGAGQEVSNGNQAAQANNHETSDTPASSQSKESELNFGALDNGDMSSLVGTWTNANGESVTINADGTIVKNSTGYTAELKAQGVSENVFYAGVVSENDSASLRAVPGNETGRDYLVIGQDQSAEGLPYYRN